MNRNDQMLDIYIILFTDVDESHITSISFSFNISIIKVNTVLNDTFYNLCTSDTYIFCFINKM